MATGGYNLSMYISIKEAKDQFSELVHLAEKGESVVVTRHGKAVAEIISYKAKKRGINFAAGRQFLKEQGVDKVFSYIAPDFDDPLPEDFLITPEK
jgi:prevent-host-death family protein